MKKNWTIWDLEAGGLKPERSSIYSISSLYQNQVTNLFAKPVPGTVMSQWSRSQVWEPIRRQAKGTEQEALSSFLQTLQQRQGQTFAGWNIGYPDSSAGYDIPFIQRRAEKYGLQEQFQKAFAGVEVRDIGREYAYKLAKTLGRHKDVIDPDLWRSLETYRNVGMAFQKQGLSERQAAEQLARSGYKIAGWKQEQAYELLTGKKYTAHQSQFDIAALQEIAESKIPTTREFAVKWNSMAVQQRTISSILSGAPAWEKEATHYVENIEKAKKYGISNIEDLIAAEAEKRGADLSRLRAGLGFKEEFQKVGGKISFAGKTPEISKLLTLGAAGIKKHPFVTGIGLTLGLAYLTKPLSAISSKDDDYNTIQGLQHKGVAGRTRRENTDFGSGWRGLLRSKSLWTATGIIAGIGGLGYGIHKLHGYLEERDPDRRRYLANIKHRFTGYTSSLEKHGVFVGTGHKRILIPKSKFTEEDIEQLGFTGTVFAIPESGQDQLTSYRNPYNPYHLHSHGEFWSVHKDRHAAITMSIKKVWADKDAFLTNIAQSIAEIPAGVAHIVTEGIPGAYYWLRNKYSQNIDMAEKIRREQGLKFSGKDDDYNTIEGLRHGGLAEQKRKELTDFGSGWVRRALSKGIELEKIATASKTLGKELTIETTSQGTRWLTGKQLGKGGFGKVFEAFQEGTGRAGVYKYTGLTQALAIGTEIGSPAFFHRTKVTGLTTKELTATQSLRDEFARNYMSPTSEAFIKTTSEYGGMGAMHESAMQRLAREKFGNMVPEVYGETSTGLFMESAGKSLKDNPVERVKALEWMQKEWAGKQLGQSSKFDELGNLIKQNEYLYHLDPQIGNIMKKGKRYMMIDWGVAAKTTQPLSRETIHAADEAFAEYVSIEKAKLKIMQQSMHQKAVQDLATHSLRPGQGHTKMTKKIAR